MLFISNNKKIDAVVKKLQPRLKLKINVERDFDCGLNDVFEKRPDVVFIQNQIAGVTGESVARHIQLLLGGAAPKFIFIHDGDIKAKPKKGVYEYLIDLSQSEEAVAEEVLEKLNLVLGPLWQNIFGASVLQGVAYEAFTPPPEPPRAPDSSFSFDSLPGTEAVSPYSATSVSPLELTSEIAPDESFIVISETGGHPADIIYPPGNGRGVDVAAPFLDDNSSTEGFSTSVQSAFPATSSDLSAPLQPTSQNKPLESVPSTVNDEKSRLAAKSELAEQNMNTSANSLPEEKTHASSFALSERDAAELQKASAEETSQWIFEGEPSLKKSTWKWYQLVEVFLVLCLLLGGWLVIKQKSKSVEPVANEVNLLQSAVNTEKAQETARGSQRPLPVELPSFIPRAGLDPTFAEKNPGWQRYLGDGLDFRLYREDDKLKAVQVKADKGRVIGDSLIKAMLMELTGAGEYQVRSRENKLGFLVLSATVSSKAEMLIYTKKSAVHAVVVALN